VALERVVLVGGDQGEHVVICRVSWAVRDPETDIFGRDRRIWDLLSGVRYKKTRYVFTEPIIFIISDSMFEQDFIYDFLWIKSSL
jgi:hypothetical protein